MKGGTALRFTLGLPRPSMDLDFEGEKPIWLRWTVKKAIKTAFPGERYRVGFDLTRVGTIPIRPPRKRAGRTPNLGIDYRETGSMNDMPECIPLEACTQHEGIQIYKPDALVHRKLATLIGPSPREKARDNLRRRLARDGTTCTHRKRGQGNTAGLARSQITRRSRQREGKAEGGRDNRTGRRRRHLETADKRDTTVGPRGTTSRGRTSRHAHRRTERYDRG